MSNSHVFRDAVRITLLATFYPEDNLLDVKNTDDFTLVEWYGIEDPDDARGRLQQTFGLGIADYIPLHIVLHDDTDAEVFG